MPKLIDITAPAEQQEGSFSILKIWLKQPGEHVLRNEPIAELETDKVALEIAAPLDGIVKELLRNIDDEIEPGAVIARLSPGPAASETIASAQTSRPMPDENIERLTVARGMEEPRHSPAVRRLIAEHGLAGVPIAGTGRDGRVTKQDILDHIARSGAPKQPEPVADNEIRHTPHSSMRKQIAAHMQNSLSVAPHVTALFEADLTALMADRRRRHAEFEARGVKLTYTAYFVRACVEGLRAVPELNSRYYEDRLDIYTRLNIGIGTALGDKGLVVPVIHDAQNLDLFGIASKLQDVTRRARSGSLTPKDMQGGTFSISNHGVSGSLLAAPIIIPQPQSAILGIGKMEKRVVVEETPSGDAMAIRNMAFITLSIDHRVLDGHQSNQFLTVFTDCIANWSGEPA